MEVLSIIYGNTTINYELVYQERKTLGIKVYPSCKVKVLAPINSEFDKIELKIKEKARWIIKQQNEFLSYHPLTPPRNFINGETHLYLGRQYRLKVVDGIKNEVKLYRGRIIVSKKKGNSTEIILNDWYRERANMHFTQTLEKVFPKFSKHKIEVPELSIRVMLTRWGSCTSKGKVILNPELIKAPKGSIEYVIIHELCHLIEHNHTSAFYNLQEKMMSDWKKWKEILEHSLV
jgi:predicted metal-dependent hydrolase